ncbi:MAG TPA: response regulator [Marinobacterium sp.]|nr:response regulator [Marinobacterium sp.]
MKVLIVDDSAVSREHLAFFCREQGFSPVLFDNGQQLLDWINVQSIEDALLLLDWEMPDIEGPDLCRRIRNDFPDAATYLLLVTARASSEDLAEGLGAGADDYITKPFDAMEISARLAVGVRTLALRRKLNQANAKRFAAERYAGVGQLAAGAAHEINNPLGFLKSNLSFLQDNLPASLGLLQRALDPQESIEAVRSEMSREQILETIDDFSDLMSEMNLGVERVSAIIKALKNFSDQLPHKYVDIQLPQLFASVAPPNAKISLQTTRSLCADEPQIKELLEALVENALWATRDGGDVELLAYDRGSEILLEVRDTGCGIAPENLERVLDPFFTTRPVGEAIGMGLSKAQAIVRNHGGSLQVTSHPESGTRVSCEFPLES